MSLLNTKRDVEDLFESAGVSIKEDAINTCMDLSPPPTEFWRLQLPFVVPARIWRTVSKRIM